MTAVGEPQFVPCIESPDATHVDWVVCNYLDADDIRFRGGYKECEEFVKETARINRVSERGACPNDCRYACGPESECWRLQQKG